MFYLAALVPSHDKLEHYTYGTVHTEADTQNSGHPHQTWHLGGSTSFPASSFSSQASASTWVTSRAALQIRWRPEGRC